MGNGRFGGRASERSGSRDMAMDDDFTIAKAKRDELDKKVTETSARLNRVSGNGSGAMGLTPESIRSSPEWKIAKQDFDKAFAALRNYNAWFVKAYAKELKVLRASRR